MAVKFPLNIKRWIDENRHLLKPPVANKNLYPEGSDFIVMVVAGPNNRKDFHYNETEEFFYQLEGDIQVVVQDEGEAKTLDIREGEFFLLPAGMPHNPKRPAGTLGLVIEAVRKGTGKNDGLMWFCEECNHPLHEYKFPLENIEKDFQPRFKEFYESEELRTCKKCSHVMQAPAPLA